MGGVLGKWPFLNSVMSRREFKSFCVFPVRNLSFGIPVVVYGRVAHAQWALEGRCSQLLPLLCMPCPLPSCTCYAGAAVGPKSLRCGAALELRFWVEEECAAWCGGGPGGGSPCGSWALWRLSHSRAWVTVWVVRLRWDIYWAGAASPVSCCCTCGPRQEPACGECCSGRGCVESGVARPFPEPSVEAQVFLSPALHLLGLLTPSLAFLFSPAFCLFCFHFLVPVFTL